MKLRRFVNPLMAFIGIQFVWVVVVVFWIYWFVGKHRQLQELAERYRHELPQFAGEWLIMVEGLVLLGVILAGVYVIFLFWRRQAALNKEQKAFINQVTHELKSPLASIRLHLETIRLRHPTAEQLDGFVTTMLADSNRLQGLITKLLEAGRLEQRGLPLSLRPRNLSEFVMTDLERRQAAIPEGGRMVLDIEPGLYAMIEPEAFEMVLRNLLENAVNYSPAPPRITVRLFADGNRCHLSFADCGRGIEPSELKRVFRMFYQARRTGDRTHGTGLGLFIVWALVRRHKGKVWAESPGVDRGAVFHIVLPRIDPPAREAVE